ncbi:MAG: amidohydrolase, partial [Oscillospiraceae bacterium]
ENPELSLKEEKTSEKILEIVKSYNLPYEMVGDYGIIARLEGKNSGKTVMLRADIDALPVKESPENLKVKKLAVSKNEGVSHACGHDAHIAILLGAMDELCSVKDEINGTVLFVFEQAEETGSGIMPMLKALSKYKIDTCYGTHVYAGLKAGKISLQPGKRMAAITSFEIQINGKGGHVSRPDLTINPLMCAANILVNINNIWTNEVDPTKTVTMGMATMHCGEKSNVIADYATFGGSMRYYDVQEGKKAFESLKRVCECVAQAHRCTVEYKRIFEAPYIVNNDEQRSKVAIDGLTSLLGSEVIGECPPWFATESMSLYLAKYPGVFAFLGIEDVENGFGAGHHTKEFDMSDDVLKLGVAACVKYTVDSL